MVEMRKATRGGGGSRRLESASSISHRIMLECVASIRLPAFERSCQCRHVPTRDAAMAAFAKSARRE
jgi:hypothetical protein